MEETTEKTVETTTTTIPEHDVRREEKRTTGEPQVVKETVTETVESD